MTIETPIGRREKKIEALTRKRQTVGQRLTELKRDLSGMSQWLEHNIIDEQAAEAFKRTLRSMRREATKLTSQCEDIEHHITELQRIIEALTKL